jgi:hypothetical protein
VAADRRPLHELLADNDSLVRIVNSDGVVTTLAELKGHVEMALVSSRNLLVVRIDRDYWSVVRTLEFGAHYLVAHPGCPEVFELAKSASHASGAGRWTLRKARCYDHQVLSPLRLL